MKKKKKIMLYSSILLIIIIGSILTYKYINNFMTYKRNLPKIKNLLEKACTLELRTLQVTNSLIDNEHKMDKIGKFTKLFLWFSMTKIIEKMHYERHNSYYDPKNNNEIFNEYFDDAINKYEDDDLILQNFLGKQDFYKIDDNYWRIEYIYENNNYLIKAIERKDVNFDGDNDDYFQIGSNLENVVFKDNGNKMIYDKFVRALPFLMLAEQ